MRWGDFAKFRYGKMPDKNRVTNDESLYPIFSGYRITGYYDEYNTEKNEIIVVARGVGGTGDVKLTANKCYLTNLSITADIDENIAFKKYIYYYFQKSNLRYLDSGSAQSQITISDLQNVMIELPPIPEQKAIAETLSCLDDKIELNNKINANLEQTAQAIFKSWFVDFEPFQDGEFMESELGMIPKGWRVGRFKDIISTTLNGDWGKDKPDGNNTEEVFCIRGADIPEVVKGNKGKMPTRYILPKNFTSKHLEENDIVVEISGGSPTQSTGRIALITKALLERYDKGMVCTNFCKAVKPIEGYSTFIYYYWQNLYNQNTMFSYENGTTGIKNFDMNGFLESEPIVIPTYSVVSKFYDMIAPVFESIFADGLENETLAKTRDAILPKLMSGEIDVSQA